MTPEDREKLWGHFVDAAEVDGRDGDKKDENGEPKQAAYSLYKAFYKDHKEYAALNSKLIRAYFGEENLSFTKEEDLDEKIREEFGEAVNDYIEKRPRINEAQKKAIKNGLVQPVTLVQGPPGTGKTDMILNFLAVITKLSPESTVAVVSCNSEALSNITDALAAKKEQAIKNNTPDDIMVEVCDRCAILGNQNKRKEWSSKVGRNFLSNMDQYVFKRTLLEKYPIFTSTIHSLPNIFSEEVLFDYVIIDECSQVSVSLGIVAMAYAKHLMPVGDNLQLQAIIPQEALKQADLLSTNNKDQQKYFEEDGKSFLKACETLFPDAPNVLLNEHYRCHQSIAGFCNEYVYAAHGSKLKVQTSTPKEEREDCRIDITWYDGKYMENLYKGGRILTGQCKKEYEEKGPLPKPNPDDKPPSQRCNFRQIRIFMEEMLPLLKETLKELKSETNKAELPYKEMPSVCVLAPFCVQLEVLRDELNKDKELKELLKDELIEIDGDPNDDSDEKKQKKDNENDLQSLSIHKSQGRGYDIVYLMTVEDDYSVNRIPWGQKMRIINVAVSRAKKELHIITSRIWIPQYIQKELPEYKNEKAANSCLSPLPECLKIRLGGTPDEKDEKVFYNCTEESWEKEDESKGNFYIGRLCQWVYEKWYKKPNTKTLQNQYGSFGFCKAKTNSIFDSFAGNNTTDFHERIRNALADGSPSLNKDNIVVKASLNDAPQLTEALKNVKEPKNKPDSEQKWLPLNEEDFDRKDFIFLCEDNYIKAIIHVLDCRYRNACKEEYGFLKRLQWRIAKTMEKNKYIEIPTNGAFGGNIEEILKKYDASSNTLIFEGNPVINLLKSKTGESLDAVMEVLYEEGKFRFVNTADQEENIRIINALKLNYGNATDIVYEESALLTPLTQQYYLCRYGTAYAFEYALMYDIVFRCAMTKEFQILSLGCGSCIDALAAVYSKYRLGKDITLTYKGIDCVDWEISFLDDIHEYFDAANVGKKDIVGYFENLEDKKLSSNIIFFPKILNELDEKTREKLLAAVGKCSLDTNVDEYYFCASHSSSDAGADSKVLEQFINALGNHEQYSYSGSVSSFFDFDKDESFKNMWGLKKENMLAAPDNNGIYKFNRELLYEEKVLRIQDLNADFSDSDTDEKMEKNVVNDLKNMNEKAEREFRHRITKADKIAFQIIRLKKQIERIKR